MEKRTRQPKTQGTGPRGEEQIVSQAPIKVVLGGKPYDIAPLVIKESRGWREEVVKLLASLPQYASITTENPEQFESGINALLMVMPDRIIDLFFQYGKNLPRDEIEDEATDLELADAFQKVVDVAFPLLGGLTTLADKIAEPQ